MCRRWRIAFRREAAFAVEQPRRVIVEAAVELAHATVVHEQQAIRRYPQQVPVMRHDDHGPVVILQCHRERLAHVEVEVVRRLVEQQQVRATVCEQGQRETRFLAAGERRRRHERGVAGEAEAAEPGAQRGFLRPGIEQAQVLDRRRVRLQLLDLVLGEVTDLQVTGRGQFAAARRQRAGQQLDERGLARPVRAQQADAIAGLNREPDVLEYVGAVVAHGDPLETEQRPGIAVRRRQAEMKR